MGFQFIHDLSFRDVPFILNGILVTLQITFLSVLFGTALGFIIGLLKLKNNFILNGVSFIYIESFRNTPVIAQLFFIYFGIPVMFPEISLSSMNAAIIGLSLNTAAFIAIIVSTSISAIDKGQWEAATALGHSKYSTFIHVIFKQAIRLFIPPAISLYVSQLQVTSVVALINIQELTHVGKSLNAKTHQPFLVWGIIMLIYFLLSFPISKYAHYLENKFSRYVRS